MINFKRILLKLSGEGLSGNSEGNMLDPIKVTSLAQDLKFLINNKVEIAIVIGGGNICRGVNCNKYSFNRTVLDNMGMLSTVINGLALSDILEQNGIPSVVFSALEINRFTQFYNVSNVKKSLQEQNVVILVGGIATSFFSTDTTAVVRAAELGCEVVLKATQVDGIFDKDPKKYKDAIKINNITYDEVIKNNLLVMDMQSIIIAKNTNMPIYIFNMHQDEALKKFFNNNLVHSVIR